MFNITENAGLKWGFLSLWQLNEHTQLQCWLSWKVTICPFLSIAGWLDNIFVILVTDTTTRSYSEAETTPQNASSGICLLGPTATLPYKNLPPTYTATKHPNTAPTHNTRPLHKSSSSRLSLLTPLSLLLHPSLTLAVLSSSPLFDFECWFPILSSLPSQSASLFLFQSPPLWSGRLWDSFERGMDCRL